MKGNAKLPRRFRRMLGLPVLTALAVVAGPAGSTRAQDAALDAQKQKDAAEATAERARAEETRRLARSILGMREELTGRSFDPGFTATVMRRMHEMPIDVLYGIESSGARGNLQAEIAATRAVLSPGVEDDLLLMPTRVAEPNAVSGVAESGGVYVPVAPCRILDTRLTGAGPLAPGGPRSFLVTGGDLSAQGGSATGCGVPTGTATAALVNFVAVSPAGPGNLRAWAYAQPAPPAPVAVILNYSAVSGLDALANGIGVPLCDPLATTCTNDILLQAFANSVDVVADVVGYFRTPPTSFVAIGRASGSTLFQAPCTHYAGAVVGIDVPAPGQVLVRANVMVRVDHTTGATDFVAALIGASPADCAANYGDATFVWMNNEATALYYPTLPISRLFTVSTPGTYFYYVNGWSNQMPYNDYFWFAGLQATYHPD